MREQHLLLSCRSKSVQNQPVDSGQGEFVRNIQCYLLRKRNRIVYYFLEMYRLTSCRILVIFENNEYRIRI